MLKDDINKSLMEAMKAKDEKTTLALRNIKTKVLEASKKELNKEVSDAEVMAILSKLAKERKQSIELYEKGNRQDLVDAETFELSIIESYLPKQMSEAEITEKVEVMIKENNFASIRDMGKVIKVFNETYPGVADGKTLSTIVKAKLES